ncbi:MAG: alkylhydroperoxidase [Kordiimonadales bacterium]|nr:MAG: alkylhydroperoxidase [Kordiimonadales bacterium]
MTWINTVSYEDAKGRLKAIYERIKGPDNNIDNILMSHSLRPHTLEGHMTLYKYVLHHPSNTLPKWLLEVIGTYVSMLNVCDYCIEHHFAGLKRLLADDVRSAAIRSALEAASPALAAAEMHLDAQHVAALDYAAKLTKTPTAITPVDIETLRTAGFDDGEILEINQVTAYFAYANRTVLGLGVNKEGDIIGLSPGKDDDPDNWGHG